MFIIENDFLSVFSINHLVPTAEDRSYSRFSCLSYMCGYMCVYMHIYRGDTCLHVSLSTEVQRLLSLQ